VDADGNAAAKAWRAGRITSGGCTDVGPVREANEDHLLLDASLGLFVVADGMGGHQAGEVASHLAVDTVAQDLRAAPALPLTQSLSDGDAAAEPARRLGGALRNANARVFATGEGDPALSGMGTTITALLMGADHAVIGSVGDSRAYLVRGESTVQLTHDDTWLASVLGRRDGGQDAASRTHPMRHVLTSVIGARESGEPEVLSVPLEAGDLFVLTTDGLHNVVDDDTIGRIARAAPPDEAAQQLVQEALRRQTTDNVTVVVVRAG
jgi:serine/threonine protein phosphatase PrpC